MRRSSRTLLAVLAALTLFLAACGDDDGSESGSSSASGSGSSSGSESGSASGSESGSASASGSGSSSGSGSGSASASSSGSGSASASASAPAEAEEMAATPGDGGYDYASNVDSHRLVVLDLCGIGDLLDAGDFAAVETIYRDGVNSVRSDGGIRSLGGFASRDDRSHGLDAFYGTPTPLDDFVSAALSGTGVFEGQSDGVRSQGVEKGMRNQVMIAWVVHELNVAVGKAQDGNFDIQEGAVHNWDEGWAFYAGADAGCAPFGTANSRAGNFGTTGSDGETAQANEAILAAMIDGRDALLAEDVAGTEAAAAEVIRNVAITYSQAAIRYASLIEGDLADGDAELAKVHQAEGLAFWRVIEAYVVPAGADGDAINAIFDLANEPGANGFGDEVRAALQPAWDALGISADDIGTLQ
ncbi:MAG: FEA1-related lipoprotein [Actinomycetota bacterium]